MKKKTTRTENQINQINQSNQSIKSIKSIKSINQSNQSINQIKMYFIYTNNGIKKQGDISIIPDKYKKYALQQKNDALLANKLNCMCAPSIVDIGVCIEYIIL